MEEAYWVPVAGLDLHPESCTPLLRSNSRQLGRRTSLHITTMIYL